MSHNIEKVNSTSGDRLSSINIDQSNTLAFRWRGIQSVNLGLSGSGYSSGNNLPYYRSSASYVYIEYGTGVTVSNSSYSVIAPQYQYGWFDQINLPEGNYNLIHQYAAYPALSGTFAWVNNSTSAKIAPVISTENNHSSLNTNVYFVAPSGGIGIATRILSGSANGASFGSLLNCNITIIKVN